MFDELDITVTNTETETNTNTDTDTDPRAEYQKAVHQKLVEVTSPGNNILDTITSRFSGTLPLRRLADAHIATVGCGGIGSPTVKNLVAMGAKNVTVIDYDMVEAQNVGTQFHKAMDIGVPKVDALHDELLARYMLSINPIKAKVENLEHQNKLVNNTPIDILIGAVDNMEFRNTIGNELVAAASKLVTGVGDIQDPNVLLPDLYIDCRMSLGLWHVYVLPMKQYKLFQAAPKEGSAPLHTLLAKQLLVYKEEALFAPEEGMQEPCTARALGYTGENIASYVAALVDWYLRDFTSYDPQILSTFTDLTTPKTERVPFKWAMGFDARNFIPTLPDPFTEKVKAQYSIACKEIADLHEAQSAVTKKIAELQEAETLANTKITDLQAQLEELQVAPEGELAPVNAELEAQVLSIDTEEQPWDNTEEEETWDNEEDDEETLQLDWRGITLTAGMEVALGGGETAKVEYLSPQRVVLRPSNTEEREEGNFTILTQATVAETIKAILAR
jgi:molybdopterin/thiamine biosynthesis adenylyltransferase